MHSLILPFLGPHRQTTHASLLQIIRRLLFPTVDVSIQEASESTAWTEQGLLRNYYHIALPLITAVTVASLKFRYDLQSSIHSRW